MQELSTLVGLVSSRLKGRLPSRDERGFVALWGALLMTLMLGLVGLSLDLGSWYINIQRTQNAADAAALAGDSYLPADVGTAVSTARKTLISNGVSSERAAGAVIQQVPGKPTQLSVALDVRVQNHFLTFLGVKKFVHFNRSAIADHKNPLRLGNGTNVLGGYEPGPVKWGSQMGSDGGFWVAVEGSNAGKVDGDRILTRFCDSRYYGPPRAYAPTVSNCNTNTNTNTEYDPRGYAYRIEVDKSAVGGVSKLVIQSYDAGFADAGGQRCNEGSRWVGVDMSDPNSCAGDAAYQVQIGNPGVARTDFSIYDSVKSTRPIASCRSYPGTLNASRTARDPNFAWVHQWSTVCDPISVDLSKDNLYVLRVTSIGGDGTNKFALRAGLSPSGDPTNVNIAQSRQLIRMSADVHMSVFNKYEAQVQFPVTQITTAEAGRSVNLEFFDIGDSRLAGAYQRGTLTLVDDRGNMLPGTCNFTPPARALGGGPGPCTRTVGAQGGIYQGQLVKFAWTVPENWVCNPTSKSRSGGCFISVRINFPASAVTQDFSTWSLTEPGLPLGLVK